MVRTAWFLAVRLLRRRGTALLRTSALAALSAVALGAASLVVVLALMSGYAGALRNGVLAAGGHLVAMLPPAASSAQSAAAAARVARLRGVVRVGPVVYLPGMLLPESGDADLVSVRATDTPPAFVHVGVSATGPLPVALGRGVARRLAVQKGSLLSLQVVTAGMPRGVPVVVAQVFDTGFAELDERFVITSLGGLRRRVPGLPDGGLEVWVADPDRAASWRGAIETACGNGSVVTTWQESNRNLFAALRWQKLSLGLVLSLVLGVGAFEVASALVVLVTEKRREFGVLLALGGPPRLLRRTLLLAGGVLGAAGVLVGIALGVAIVLTLNALGIPHFPPDIAAIYMVDTIPFRLLPSDLGAVLGLSLLEVLAAAFLPAARTARREPVEVLRWV